MATSSNDQLQSNEYWCPNNFDDGIKNICDCIQLYNKQIPNTISEIIAHFVIGEKWPFTIFIKRDNPIGEYESIDIYPNSLGESLYAKSKSKLIDNKFYKHFNNRTVLINRTTCRKLLKNKSLLEQNVFPGTKFECTLNFKGKGRLYQMW